MRFSETRVSPDNTTECPAKSIDARWTDNPEVKLVPAVGRGPRSQHIEERVDKLAKQGYRLALTSWMAAVMYRDHDDKTGFSYVWLNPKTESLEKRLAQLQASGAVYLTTYEQQTTGRAPIDNKLVFEQKLVDDGKRREYKVLKFEFHRSSGSHTFVKINCIGEMLAPRLRLGHKHGTSRGDN